MLNEAVFYTRMALGLRQMGKSERLADPAAAVRWQMANRESTFLELVRRGVYDNPHTPYREMLRLAGCEYGDLARGVQQNGIESTLGKLRAAGVYLTHDEFKYRQPIVRSGQEIPSYETCFENPTLKALYRGRSSGSRNRVTPTPYSLEFLLYRNAHNVLRLREMGIEGKAYIIFRPTLPAPGGLMLTTPRGPNHITPDCWFAEGGSLAGNWHYRIATHAMARFNWMRWNDWLGGRAMLPTYLPPNDFSPIAEWVGRRKTAGVATIAHLTPSNAVRVAAAALDRGIDIAGTTFICGGEGTSEAKRQKVREAGGTIHSSYPMSEIGSIGAACRHMTEGNSVHLFEDTVAVLTDRRKVPFAEEEANVLLFTTLLPFAGQILINADLGDTGTIIPTRCDCTFSRMGFHKQICDISSHSKLTGYGVTLVGTDVVRVLEEFLPARLGGMPYDYQLVQHDDHGQSQISLHVSPRVGVDSAARVKALFLEGIQGYFGGKVAVRLWKHAEAVNVVFAEPLKTGSGKVLPLYLQKPVRRMSEA